MASADFHRHRTTREALDALQLLINNEHSLHIPVQPNDADVVLGDVIAERDALRKAAKGDHLTRELSTLDIPDRGFVLVRVNTARPLIYEEAMTIVQRVQSRVDELGKHARVLVIDNPEVTFETLPDWRLASLGLMRIPAPE